MCIYINMCICTGEKLINMTDYLKLLTSLNAQHTQGRTGTFAFYTMWALGVKTKPASV